MPRLKHKLPSYCRHKASGQAVVSIDSRDVYLGRYGSTESKTKYEQVISRWLATRDEVTITVCQEAVSRDELRINELIVAYFEFADGYYRRNGVPTGEINNIKDAVRPLGALYKMTRVARFGPTELKGARDAMVGSGLSRRVINARINRIRRVFKWGVENDLVEPQILQALQAVAPLKKGRTTAKDYADVQPVPREHIEAVRMDVSEQVRAMIELQLLTGMRPGEVILMRPCDIDRSKSTWLYRPSSHKTEHHGIERRVFVGPQAQAIIKPFLLRDGKTYLFSPQKAMLEHKRKRRRESKYPKIRACADLKITVSSRVGMRYTRTSYHNAIYKSCRRLSIAPWGPNRLRHNAATLLREQYGIEAARVVLGHTSPATTEVYAEFDRGKAADVMAEVG
jgi:integrase